MTRTPASGAIAGIPINLLIKDPYPALSMADHYVALTQNINPVVDAIADNSGYNFGGPSFELGGSPFGGSSTNFGINPAFLGIGTSPGGFFPPISYDDLSFPAQFGFYPNQFMGNPQNQDFMASLGLFPPSGTPYGNEFSNLYDFGSLFTPMTMGFSPVNPKRKPKPGWPVPVPPAPSRKPLPAKPVVNIRDLYNSPPESADTAERTSHRGNHRNDESAYSNAVDRSSSPQTPGQTSQPEKKNNGGGVVGAIIGGVKSAAKGVGKFLKKLF